MPDPKKPVEPIVVDPSKFAAYERASPNQKVPVPNTMQALDPALIAALPPFLRNLGAQMGKADDPHYNWIAHVNAAGKWGATEEDLKKIRVDEPKMFTRPIAAHEATHVFQNTRNEGGQPTHQNPPSYEYGGAEGLRQARLEKRTIAYFNVEQQAQIVEDYYGIHLAVLEIAKMQNGHLWPAQAHWFERQKEAYQPFVNQLIGIPSKDEIPSDFPTEPKSPVPGLPPANVTNELQLDPNIAGALAPIPVWRTGKEPDESAPAPHPRHHSRRR